MKWSKKPALERGILCGADHLQEWLLPWWWERYRQSNDFPVAFIDFGMSQEAKGWCAERGELIELEWNHSFVAPRSAIDETEAKHWESFYGWTIWNARQAWFKKPMALLQSPFKTAIWLDLDCEVLGGLESLFSHSKIALVREAKSKELPKRHVDVLYNGGVIVFKHGSRLIEKWAARALDSNHLFWGDDPMLSHLIYQERASVIELPDVYNWRMAQGLNLNAVIVHWVGSGGKAYIREHGGLKPALDIFYRSFHSLPGGNFQ